MSERAAEMAAARVYSTSQVLFPQISHKAFTYPGDDEALAAMTRIPGATKILTYLQENFSEQYNYLENNEQMVRAGTANFPSLYNLVVRCSEILSCPVPEVYISNAPAMNAYTAGQRRTCIVFHASLLCSLRPDELSFVIGHEIGHIKCGHGIYRQLGDLLLKFWDAASSSIPVPGIGLARIPLLLAYWEWYRRAEFTCDRAGLLCVQVLQPCLEALGRLASGQTGIDEELHIESIVEQGEAHHEVNKLVKLVSILNNAQNTHPFVPMRLRRLTEYASSVQFKDIMLGKYVRDVLGLHEGGIRIKCFNRNCGNTFSGKDNFCPKCGTPAERKSVNRPIVQAVQCINCPNILTVEMKFCTKCGSARPMP